MFTLDTGEPFGLPKGTIRGVLALAFSASVLFLWLTGQPVSEAQLGITTLIVGNYFGARGSSPAAEKAAEPLAEPAVGDGE